MILFSGSGSGGGREGEGSAGWGRGTRARVDQSSIEAMQQSDRFVSLVFFASFDSPSASPVMSCGSAVGRGGHGRDNRCCTTRREASFFSHPPAPSSSPLNPGARR